MPGKAPVPGATAETGGSSRGRDSEAVRRASRDTRAGSGAGHRRPGAASLRGDDRSPRHLPAHRLRPRARERGDVHQVRPLHPRGRSAGKCGRGGPGRRRRRVRLLRRQHATGRPGACDDRDRPPLRPGRAPDAVAHRPRGGHRGRGRTGGQAGPPDHQPLPGRDRLQPRLLPARARQAGPGGRAWLQARHDRPPGPQGS